MNIYTVSLFGHRKISDIYRIDEALTPLIKSLIQTKSYVSFLIGRNGEFDEYASAVIKRIQKEIGVRNNEISLVLPYSVSDIEYYDRYYDNVIIPRELSKAHPKSAITLKNRWMIERSDLVIVYTERESGGAYVAKKYAQRLCKEIINI